MALAGYAKDRLAAAGVELAFSGKPTFKEFAVRVGRSARDVVRDARPRASIPAMRSAATTRGWTTRCSSLSPRSGRRPRSTGSPRCSRRCRDDEAHLRAVRPGRRASSAPAATTSRRPVPPELARASAAAPARGRRARARPPLHRAVDAQLRDRHRLLSARLVHDEVQPAGQRAARAVPGFRDLHPLQEEDGAQGALELMWRLQEILAEVSGLDAVTLQPAAGAQGELTG